MDTNDDKLLYEEEVFQIVGCAIEVLNTIGHGMVESHTKMRWSWSLDCEIFRTDSNLFSTFSTKPTKSGCLSLI